MNDQLGPAFGSIWFVGGGAVCGECLRRGLADEGIYEARMLTAFLGDPARVTAAQMDR